jgi:DNA-directed RNA polymerase subunit RPC12/RpoP
MLLVKCPKCKAEIDSVNYYESGLMVFQKGEWLKDDNPDTETTCPECGAKISIDETKRILKL